MRLLRAFIGRLWWQFINPVGPAAPVAYDPAEFNRQQRNYREGALASGIFVAAMGCEPKPISDERILDLAAIARRAAALYSNGEHLE